MLTFRVAGDGRVVVLRPVKGTDSYQNVALNNRVQHDLRWNASGGDSQHSDQQSQIDLSPHIPPKTGGGLSLIHI